MGIAAFCHSSEMGMTVLYAIEDSKLRKLLIGIVSLAVMLGAFWLYKQRSPTPEIDRPRPSVGAVADSNVGGPDDKIGMIDDKTGIGRVQKARYTRLDKYKRLEQEFGFDALLHEEGDEWEVEKPYLNLYRRRFRCYVTADRGKVRVETAEGTVDPKDARFTGNVVVHIVPEASSDIRESFIYLDDIDFESERSRFTTAGPVKYVSADGQMLGRGLELIYNEQLNRLEVLRIIDMELRLKTSSRTLFSEQRRTGQASGKSPAPTSARSDVVRLSHTDRATLARESQDANEASTQGEYYRCVFMDNVLIATPDELAFANKKICINDIFWAKPSSEEPNQTETGGADTAKAPTRVGGKADKVGTDSATPADVPAPDVNEPNEAAQEFVDIVVTCDNGFVVTPMDSTKDYVGDGKANSEKATETGSKEPNDFEDPNARPTLVAKEIDYSVPTGDALTSGPTKLTFYTRDPFGGDANEATLPMKVTAQKHVRFSRELNQVFFEGDCRCNAVREDPNGRQEYNLSAPQIRVDLAKDKSDRPSGSMAADIDHLTASGGTVQLDTSKWAGEELLGFIKLRCDQFDFDTEEQLFMATRGLIAVDNANIAEPNDSNAPKFSLRRPCYALVENFETLRYFLARNLIVADAKQVKMNIGYIPMVKGQPGEPIKATASHVEVNLVQTAPGRLEVATLLATGGITYNEKDIEFVGSDLFYDANEAVMRIHGDDFQPCYFNGALVDLIEYDLKTGKISFEITGPGALQMK